MNFFYLFAFRTNADAGNFLFLGKGIEVWLNYTLVFFGFTAIAFMATWLVGVAFNKNTEEYLE